MTVQEKFPAVYMRGGTSRGVFFHRRDLPADPARWDALFLALLGSPDPYGRQLDGLGVGISSLSKVVVVGPPSHPAADVDYTFAQVGVEEAVVDYHGICGNLTSAVGPFAVDEGLVPAGALKRWCGFTTPTPPRSSTPVFRYGTARPPWRGISGWPE